MGWCRDEYLFRVHDVHDDAALEHAGEAGLDGEGIGCVIAIMDAIGGGMAIADGEVGCHGAERVCAV
jgi:hypothetical protein